MEHVSVKLHHYAQALGAGQLHASCESLQLLIRDFRSEVEIQLRLVSLHVQRG